MNLSKKSNPLLLLSLCYRIRATSCFSGRSPLSYPFFRTQLVIQKVPIRYIYSTTLPSVSTKVSYLSMSDNSDGHTDSNKNVALTVCDKCKGEGKIVQPPSRKAKKRHKLASTDRQNNQHQSPPPPRIDGCTKCDGFGLIVEQTTAASSSAPAVIGPSLTTTTKFPHVGIVGAGLGGLALAVACRHRTIPFTVYERDSDFFQRSQGYGLTMQQASRALKALGIPVPLSDGIVSTKHVVHTQDGKVVGEWGLRKWRGKEAANYKQGTPNGGKNKNNNRRQNVHIARQSLRWELLKALGGSSQVQWGHKLIEYQDRCDGVDVVFEVIKEDGTMSRETYDADLLVGADGIRSTVRKQWLGEDLTPLRYLGCIVILGICPLSPAEVEKMHSPLLDGETVFQTADGSTRIYMMPYSTKEYMWQLSFPMEEDKAKALSQQGQEALKEESLKKCESWHNPIVTILEHTPVSLVSGYPVYDRALVSQEFLQRQSATVTSTRHVTCLGDAMHPMSPFKGQGANQALLDALSLARTIYKTYTQDKKGDKKKSTERDGTPQDYSLIDDALGSFEEEMLSRSSVKVKASAEAAKFLHTEVVLQEGNVTRGGAASSATVL